MNSVTHGVPAGKPVTTYSARFYIERKHSTSGYSASMIYGAAVLAPRAYRRQRTQVYVRIGRRLFRFPATLLILTRPFNIYVPGTDWGRK